MAVKRTVKLMLPNRIKVKMQCKNRVCIILYHARVIYDPIPLLAVKVRNVHTSNI